MKNWYKRSVIYSVDVEAFRDGDDDGIGDFNGLRKSLPYLASLGVDCLWILPFLETPNRDNGYDICNYFSVDKRLGNLGTFTEFMNIAQEFNIRVIIDMVVNHTSDQHPWFQEALKGPDSAYHDYYIWADEIPEGYQPKKVFGDAQSGNWEYVKELDRYYYHTFYKFQPDLNLANPRVREEIKRIMHFWLQMGVAGFRMDAVTHMIRRKHESQNFDKAPHEILHEFRIFLDDYAPHSVMLAEADVEPEAYNQFFSGQAGMHMLFNFYGNNYLFYSLASEKAQPLVDAFKKLPNKQGVEQFANFIRNHDELDLERLRDAERQRVFDHFAPDEDMRVFGRGIRRRFAPMVNGDRSLLELAYSLMFSLPGTPVLRYGDEIGMWDDLSLPGRESVRTLMQWSDRENGGFSCAPQDELVRPLIDSGPGSYEQINVNNQIKDTKSLLNWMVLAITARRRCSDFGLGAYEFLETHDDEVMVHICRNEDTASIAAHNFSQSRKVIELDIDDETADQLVDVFGDQVYRRIEPGTKAMELMPRGYRWLKTRF
jgi:maltose alpha-D-glucosyltransferase/alpha-amylase